MRHEVILGMWLCDADVNFGELPDFSLVKDAKPAEDHFSPSALNDFLVK
jgi:hypothetical protein